MYLSIEGDRRSGRTTSLVDATKNYLAAFPSAQVAFVTPLSTMGKIAQSIFADKVNPRDLKRVSFVTPGNTSLSRLQFDAYFVDNADFMPDDIMLLLKALSDNKRTSLYQTITTKEDNNVTR